MLRTFIAPIALASVILMQIIILNFSAGDLTQQIERERDYFIKPIPQSNVVVVEPNYGRFFNPDRTIEKDESGEVLYAALDELNENYDINRTQMVIFERKGQIVPNLYVHINQENAQTNLEQELPSNQLLAEQLN